MYILDTKYVYFGYKIRISGVRNMLYPGYEICYIRGTKYVISGVRKKMTYIKRIHGTLDAGGEGANNVPVADIACFGEEAIASRA